MHSLGTAQMEAVKKKKNYPIV